MQALKERYAVLERRLAATQQEVTDLNYDINTLTKIIAQARKFGTWNVSPLAQIFNFKGRAAVVDDDIWWPLCHIIMNMSWHSHAANFPNVSNSLLLNLLCTSARCMLLECKKTIKCKPIVWA
jgi:hypothetical protein